MFLDQLVVDLAFKIVLVEHFFDLSTTHLNHHVAIALVDEVFDFAAGM